MQCPGALITGRRNGYRYRHNETVGTSCEHEHMSTTPDFDLHVVRPSVFLDRWVWIRLAAADKGAPRDVGDAKVLEAVRQAALAGVAFPITSAFYVEGLGTKDPRQREDVARTIASVAFCRSIRSWRVLVRHQMLSALHRLAGRPTFPPTPPEALGVGIFWAFLGMHAPPVVHDSNGPIDPATLPGGRGLIRSMAQWGEFQFLIGAKDEDLDELRKRGYRPEVTIDAGQDRLAWEQTYVGILAANEKLSNQELRIRIQARELMHDHLDLFMATLAEYGLTISQLGFDSEKQPETRRKIAAFADSVPALRIAVDLKQHLFRNASRPWQINDLYDIDAISLAMPYCHAVLVDKMMTDFLNRSRVPQYSGTRVVDSLTDLLDILPELAARAAIMGGDPTGWSWAGPGDAFCLDLPHPSPAA